MVCSMGHEVWEGLAAQLTHLRLTACPGAFTCALFPALAVAGKLASLDLHFAGEWYPGHGERRWTPGIAGDLARCSMAAAGVPSLKAVSLRLTGIWGAGAPPRGGTRCSLASASERRGQGLLPGMGCGDRGVEGQPLHPFCPCRSIIPGMQADRIKLVSVPPWAAEDSASENPLLAGVRPGSRLCSVCTRCSCRFSASCLVVCQYAGTCPSRNATEAVCIEHPVMQLTVESLVFSEMMQYGRNVSVPGTAWSTCIWTCEPQRAVSVAANRDGSR